jgi:hypothetical protein
MLSRRAFVGKVAVGTAVVSTASAALAATTKAVGLGRQTGAGDGPEGPAPDSRAAAAGTAEASTPDVVVSAVSAPPRWELLHPLTLGAAVSHGWHLADWSGAVDGSCVLTLQNERGRAYRIHVCRNDGHPQGLVYTEHFDLVVMNGGRGDLPTEEGLAQAVAAVAHVLAANEGHQREVAASLLPHAERLQQFAGVEDARLR